MEEEVLTKEEKLNKIKSEAIEWLICLVIAIVLYLLVNYFIGTVSGIKQTSMTPTYVEGEKILIQRTKIFKKELKYGQVVTFVAPNEEDLSVVTKQENITGELIQGEDAIASYTDRNFIDSFIYDFLGIGKRSYIKRIIGLEGDHIVVTEDGKVLRNDEELTEDYLKDGITSQNGKYINVIVPEGAVFVMGDNRLGSMDSRIFGCIPVEKIDGYVVAKVWPFSKFEWYN